MKKRNHFIFGVIFLLIICGVIVIGLSRGNEDDWIKDSRGVFVKHGKPTETPTYVLNQQDAINCANNFYNSAKQSGLSFSSQCLGSCGNYSVDIVHVPRNEVDNLPENQCEDFRNGLTKYFIEIDKNGEIVRIHDSI
jgi:hypothetical protein